MDHSRISDLVYFEHEGKTYFARLLYSSKLWYFYKPGRYLFAGYDTLETEATKEIAYRIFLEELKNEFNKLD